MAIRERRERERAEREKAIITAARDLAESEGWDAVTTRRLAAEIEYSQPVLYSHFKGKEAIMAAVAVEGFADLAGDLAAAREAAGKDEAAERRGTAGKTRAAESRGAESQAAETRAAARERRVVAAVAEAYTSFAERRPALYDAMFTLRVDLPFASPDAPVDLPRGFAELAEAVRPVAADGELGALTETFWSALHGLVTLMRSGRLRRADHERRLALLVDRFSRGNGAG